MSTSEHVQNKTTQVTLLHGRKLLRARNRHAQVDNYYAWLLQYVHVTLFPVFSKLYDMLGNQNSNQINLLGVHIKTK